MALIFSAPGSYEAVLAGRKTVTRRALYPEDILCDIDEPPDRWGCLAALVTSPAQDLRLIFRNQRDHWWVGQKHAVKSSRTAPGPYRIMITSLRFERLKNITEEDVARECVLDAAGEPITTREAYMDLYQRLSGAKPAKLWRPYLGLLIPADYPVCRIEFERAQ